MAPRKPDPGGPAGADAATGVARSGADLRTAGGQPADHRAIDRLADDILPALVAKLAASGLGEIEVREGDWRIRVRRPGSATGDGHGRRAGDRPSRSQPGHAGHGHAPAVFDGHRSARDGHAVAHSTNGAAMPPLTPVGPGSEGDGDGSRPEPRPGRAIATSPAVGVYQPRPEARAGSRVRAGDRLGAVDMLGVPQEVVAPADGVVGASLVEAGQAVEYGQELIVIELPMTAAGEA